MTGTRPGTAGPDVRARRSAPVAPTLWGTAQCEGGCQRYQRATDVVAVLDLVTGRPVHLCPRCLWGQLAAQLNRRDGAGGIWDLSVCEDHPPDRVPILPHHGRLLCSDCIDERENGAVLSLTPRGGW